MLMDMAKKILEGRYACNHCLGRQFAQLLSGLTNEERGRAIRTALAMEYKLKPFSIDAANFHGYDFRTKKTAPVQPKKCAVCGDVFLGLGKLGKEAVEKLGRIDYRTIMVSTRLPASLVSREEELWEEVGIECCEPLKSELNREFGKLLLSMLEGKEFDEKTPNVIVVLDVEKGGTRIEINPLFIFGKYKKLVRGIPQTKWEMYKETVEDIIARPVMKSTRGTEHAMHAMGREDIDARCLDWRPFVFEVSHPEKRDLDLKKITEEINRTKKVEVSGLRFSDKRMAVRIKSLQPDKTYRALVRFDKPVDGLSALRKIKIIKQQTPTRVMHRRADKTRTKIVKAIAWKRISPKKYEFIIKGQAGLYIKELITGDGGRTRPSVSEVLNTPAKVAELDVIRIHVRNSELKE
ncbi:MAG: tRNA pseudouridine(54/55) synthase Pus10 [Candidatus Aenigmarchaeota archaeon]|nr:tRNA pseudouridine(54/55) synthase Pus10 [Candidatus Aenigmarchaeota archaeon]